MKLVRAVDVSRGMDSTDSGSAGKLAGLARIASGITARVHRGRVHRGRVHRAIVHRLVRAGKLAGLARVTVVSLIDSTDSTESTDSTDSSVLESLRALRELPVVSLLESTEVESTEVESTELESTELDSTELESTDSSELESLRALREKESFFRYRQGIHRFLKQPFSCYRNVLIGGRTKLKAYG
jgi:hypothetical protein